ncbi:hypothetical protein FEP26_02552 [Burkholderia multivorans]|jgi:hypothetical protein|nr:hypothetical protein [Burkholderia multivorans]MDR9060644.1 hypothetical protein [Burkholderia multivorans]MDR9062690.1 hypothetical protein [Burkholderia multivorans]MDR9078039.1 hypothetical protein [Burkholderia multivorans]MDR9093558.1 hypothetical protein [Burkholderia multivorans]
MGSAGRFFALYGRQAAKGDLPRDRQAGGPAGQRKRLPMRKFVRRWLLRVTAAVLLVLLFAPSAH